MSVDRERIEAAVSEILAAIGEDPEREGLLETPRRVAELYAELFGGVGDDPARALRSVFAAPAVKQVAPGGPGAATESGDQPVLIRDITFRSICEHHFLPFEGVVHVAYVPSDRIAGLGSIVSVVESASSRPQLQERLTDDIADAIERGLGARGVLVVVDAKHGCVSARGPRQTRSTTLTLAARGTLVEPAARAEITALIAAPRSDEHGGGDER
ncbi:GTP cyclohydrolase I [Herbiconiux ginsengi]|uniref:GTP cyclohydrolase 1 n=1 Tax=Herbiconiux ginsengi TaxID=381665 RepID=A0A1H3KFX4_9MICO|nr:GTP cyclohydrolase I [Herbiconiux ginsengi]SDY50518.1 GTP cyclohydrolase I [Herbiconiux ginsengi]